MCNIIHEGCVQRLEGLVAVWQVLWALHGWLGSMCLTISFVKVWKMNEDAGHAMLCIACGHG